MNPLSKKPKRMFKRKKNQYRRKEEPGTADQEPKEEKPKEELEQYSEGVQKRISKLTKKWREAERQKEAALRIR